MRDKKEQGLNVKAGYVRVRINGMMKKWSEVERGECPEREHAEEDSRSRNSKEDMDRIDSSRKEGIGEKEIEGEMRKKGHEKSVDSVSRQEERNFG